MVADILAVAEVLEASPARLHPRLRRGHRRPALDRVPAPVQGQQGRAGYQFDMKGVEKVGLVKFDFLGLRTLTVIDQAVRLIRRHHEAGFDIHTVPLDDPATFALLQAANTAGVFQLESGGIRSLMVRLKPSVFEDIIAW